MRIKYSGNYLISHEVSTNIWHMQTKSVSEVSAAIRRGRGRPRLDNVRVECSVPRDVFEQLVAEERVTGTYRTRVAANVLCDWAKTSDRSVRHTSS